jgi:hypothetical protein
VVAQGGNTRIAAIGLGDDEPSFADLQSTGISLPPLSPVHARYEVASDGGWNLCWTRRARGQWRWMDFVETPLVEELENYVVGAGPVSDPVASWQTAQPSMLLDGTTIAGLVSSHGSMPLWVRQVGTFGTSPPTLIGNLG